MPTLHNLAHHFDSKMNPKDTEKEASQVSCMIQELPAWHKNELQFERKIKVIEEQPKMRPTVSKIAKPLMAESAVNGYPGKSINCIMDSGNSVP